MKRIIIVALVFLVSCATFKLEQKLPNDIKEWYYWHQCIMDTPIPKDLGRGSERDYFLRLPTELQRKYIKNFWAMRHEFYINGLETKAEYANRMAVVKYWFSHEGIKPWATEFGRALLLFGQPFMVNTRDESGNLVLEGDEQWQYNREPRKQFYRIWTYWKYERSFWDQLINVTFVWDKIDRWHYIEPADSMYFEFVEYRRGLMAPTPEGWDLWRKQ